jgi:transposase
MTLSFVQYALELLRFGTIQDVSEHLGVSWDVIKDVHKRHLKDEYAEVDIASVKYVGIDEFSIAKRHKYMTVILDISTGRIIDAVEGRKREEISPILETLKKKLLVLKQLLWI